MSELNKATQKLKPHKSPGLDKVHNEMLFNLGPQGRSVLLKLINKTWHEETIPKAWRCAIITPILKKDKPAEDVKSYRPISLTSCIGKIAERMVNNRLCWWLETNHFLNNYQAGFRPGQRTDDQIFRLTQRIADGFQKGENTTAIFIDFQQAYDRVWRKGLFSKMLDLGIHGKIYSWIKNFLTDRTIQTKYDHGISSQKVLEEGLPQGSALSCTLFLIFINDLPEILDSEKALYADDVTIWDTRKHIGISARRLNEDLERLYAYCNKWKIKINCNKTVYTIFTKSNKTSKSMISLKLGTDNINKVDNPTYLGIELDSKLTMNSHVKNLKRKTTKRLNLLKQLASTRWGADKSTLRQLYIGYIRSVLDYNCALQSTCSRSTQKSLDGIQHQAARLISGAMKSTPTAACSIHANIEPLKFRREGAVIEMVERCKRAEPNHPNRKLVETWPGRRRIKHKSILDIAKEIEHKHHLPENREIHQPFPTQIPPHKSLRSAVTHTNLIIQHTKANTDPIELKRTSEETIFKYPDSWIHAYTDGSALKGTTNAGYGARINHPDISYYEIFEACGSHCSIFEAEAMAIEATIYQLTTLFSVNPQAINNIVVFSDSKSVLETLHNQNYSNKSIESLALTIDTLLSQFDIQLTLQWIPGHLQLPGNERADYLAKKGSSLQQFNSPVSLKTSKQIIKSNLKEEWLNEWALGNTGRCMFPHLPRPNPKDPIHSLPRRDQVTIFRLRIQHIPLNAHLSRILSNKTPECGLCGHESETVSHILFDCPELTDIRRTYLPPTPTIDNTLYSSSSQLKNTCTYIAMMYSRRSS